MHIVGVPFFFPEKNDGDLTKKGARRNPALSKVFIQFFLTSVSFTGDISYYLLPGIAESGSKSILCLVALSGGIPGGLRTSLDSLKINFQHKGSIPSTLVLSPPPNATNTPLVSNSDLGRNKLCRTAIFYLT